MTFYGKRSPIKTYSPYLELVSIFGQSKYIPVINLKVELICFVFSVSIFFFLGGEGSKTAIAVIHVFSVFSRASNPVRANGQKMTNRRTHNLKTKQDSDFKLSVLIDKNICRS